MGPKHPPSEADAKEGNGLIVRLLRDSARNVLQQGSLYLGRFVAFDHGSYQLLHRQQAQEEMSACALFDKQE